MKIAIYANNIDALAELVSAAHSISPSTPASAIVVNDGTLAQDAAALGLETISITAEGLNAFDFGATASVLAQCVEEQGFDTVLVPSSRKGRAIAGMLAQIIGAGCLTNVNKLACEGDKIVCSRNALGGAVVARQVASTSKQVIAVSPKSFAPAESGSGGAVKEVSYAAQGTGVVHAGTNEKAGSDVDITEADKLIVIGCGVEDQATIQSAEALASKIDALIGCTKPVAVDRKWFTEDRVVGISGKTCKPSLAILFGISGEVQFYAGIRDAKVIAAVNTDADAQIAGLSDYVLIEDAAATLSELSAAL